MTEISPPLLMHAIYTFMFISMTLTLKTFVLRLVLLVSVCLQYSQHNVSLDKDTIIQVVKSINGKYLCQVYRLFERRHAHDPLPGSEVKVNDAPSSESSAPESPRLPTPRRGTRGRRR